LGRMKRGWNVASSLTLADLRRLIESKEAETAQLSERRDDLVAELGDLDARIAANGDGGSKRGRKPGRRGPGRPRKSKAKRGRPAKKVRRRKGKRRGRKAGPKGQSDLHNAIRAALNGSSDPMKIPEIAKKVRASGYKTKSANFKVIVGSRLGEMNDVTKPARGLYALR